MSEPEERNERNEAAWASDVIGAMLETQSLVVQPAASGGFVLMHGRERLQAGATTPEVLMRYVLAHEISNADTATLLFAAALAADPDEVKEIVAVYYYYDDDDEDEDGPEDDEVLA